MKRIAIIQSNYIPWKGYFDLIAAVDEVILYDDVQFTKNDWRHRNLIKTPSGVQWLSLPAGQSIHRRIRDVELAPQPWRIKHWKALRSNYSRAACFDEVATWLEPAYLGENETRLSYVNRHLIERVCAFLGIGTRISWSWDYPHAGGRNQRLIDICTHAAADTYVSGPAARDYLDESAFAERGIAVHWFDYVGYPTYPQLWGGFVHEVSVLDLLFNCGSQSPRFMKNVGPVDC